MIPRSFCILWIPDRFLFFRLGFQSRTSVAVWVKWVYTDSHFLLIVCISSAWLWDFVSLSLFQCISAAVSTTPVVHCSWAQLSLSVLISLGWGLLIFGWASWSSRTITQGISPVFSSNGHGFTFALPQASQIFPKLSLSPVLSSAPPQVQKWHKVKVKPSCVLPYPFFKSSYSMNWTNAGNHIGIQTSACAKGRRKQSSVSQGWGGISVASDNMLGTYWSVLKALWYVHNLSQHQKTLSNLLSILVSCHMGGCLGKHESRAGCSDTSSEEPPSFQQFVTQRFL